MPWCCFLPKNFLVEWFHLVETIRGLGFVSFLRFMVEGSHLVETIRGLGVVSFLRFLVETILRPWLCFLSEIYGGRISFRGNYLRTRLCFLPEIYWRSVSFGGIYWRAMLRLLVEGCHLVENI